MGSAALSICVSIKNRSSVVTEHGIADIFPQSVRSIDEASRELGDIGIELVVADFHSTDRPLEEWLHDATRSVHVKLLSLAGPFSRGGGLNIAARHATSERLFLCDADILVGPDAIRRAIEVIDSGRAWLPVFQCLDEHGNPNGWLDYGYGLVGVTKTLLSKVGGVPEFYSWGGEDDLLRDALKAEVEVVRERREDLRHQWHPEAQRDCHYIRPRGSDYARVTAPPREPSSEIAMRLWGIHSDWTGELLLREDGRVERPGVDTGSYIFVEHSYLLLNWDRWPPEKLFWSDERGVYCCRDKAFTVVPIERNGALADAKIDAAISSRLTADLSQPSARENALTDLRQVSELLESLGINWSLQGGSVLGLYRDGGFLSNECDIDITILAEQWTPDVDRAAQELGFSSRVYHQGVGDNGLHVIWQRVGSWPIEIYPTHEACFFGKRLRYNGGDRYWRYYFPPDFVERTRQVELLGVPVRIPAATDAYLRWYFGDDYATPLGDDQWDWVKRPGARSWNFLHSVEQRISEATTDFSVDDLKMALSTEPITRIYVDGVFDLFHWGHVELFRAARALASRPYIVAGVCHEDIIAWKSPPVMTYEERVRVVSECRLVDEVVSGPLVVSKEFLDSLGIDLVVHGNDMSNANREAWYSEAIEMGIYREVSYTSSVSTSRIRDRIIERAGTAVAEA